MQPKSGAAVSSSRHVNDSRARSSPALLAVARSKFTACCTLWMAPKSLPPTADAVDLSERSLFGIESTDLPVCCDKCDCPVCNGATTKCARGGPVCCGDAAPPRACPRA